MKNISFVLLFILFSFSSFAADPLCEIETEGKFIPFRENNIPSGSYMRVHPSGDFVFHSGQNVPIIDLREKDDQGNIKPKVIPTPMFAEAYPIEGSWKFITSPLHKEGMKFFLFDDLLQKGKNATPPMVKMDGVEQAFQDKEFNNYYQSAAELAGGTAKQVTYRVAIYDTMKFREYKVNFENGTPTTVTRGPINKICKNLSLTRSSTPIFSKDGTEIALNTRYANQSQSNTTKIFKLDSNGDCEQVDDLGFSTGKVNFSYPEPGKKGKVAFIGSGNIQSATGVRPSTAYYNIISTYDRDTKVVQPVSVPYGKRNYQGMYPGFTKDGRIIFYESFSQGGNKNTYGLRIAQPKNRNIIVREYPTDEILAACFGGALANYQESIENLGKFWAQICKNGGDNWMTPDDLSLIALSLDKNKCVQIVEKKFKEKNPSSSLTKEFLLSACQFEKKYFIATGKPSEETRVYEARKQQLRQEANGSGIPVNYYIQLGFNCDKNHSQYSPPNCEHYLVNTAKYQGQLPATAQQYLAEHPNVNQLIQSELQIHQADRQLRQEARARGFPENIYINLARYCDRNNSSYATHSCENHLINAARYGNQFPTAAQQYLAEHSAVNQGVQSVHQSHQAEIQLRQEARARGIPENIYINLARYCDRNNSSSYATHSCENHLINAARYGNQFPTAAQQYLAEHSAVNERVQREFQRNQAEIQLRQEAISVSYPDVRLYISLTQACDNTGSSYNWSSCYHYLEMASRLSRSASLPSAARAALIRNPRARQRLNFSPQAFGNSTTNTTAVPIASTPVPAGQAIWQQRCSSCHGAGSPYPITLQRNILLGQTRSPNSQGSSTIINEMIRRISSSNHEIRMPLGAAALSSEDIEQLVNYARRTVD